jgi:uncharacterized protein YkwD
MAKIKIKYSRTGWIYLLVLICYSFLYTSCKKEVVKEPPLTEELSVTMLEKVNALRKSGCNCGTTYMPPVRQLQWNEHLELAAQHHGNDMYYNNYFGHISLTGSNPVQRAENAGYRGPYVLENIAKDYTFLDAVMVAWQHSESHCMAIMDSSHTIMGAARAGNYWVQEFGKE